MAKKSTKKAPPKAKSNAELEKAFSANRAAKRQSFPVGNDIECIVEGIKMVPAKYDKGETDVVLTLVTDGNEDKEESVKDGLKTEKRYQLYDRKTKSGKEMSGEKDFESLNTDLTVLGFDPASEECEDMGLTDIIKEINDDELVVVVNAVANKTNPQYTNIYLQELVEFEDSEEEEDDENEEEDEVDENEEDSEEEEDDSEEEEEDSDDEDSEEEEEDDEEEEDEEEEEDFIPTKGMIVMAKPPKKKTTAEYKVISSNKANQTCTLKNVKLGTITKEVPWEKIDGEVDDE